MLPINNNNYNWNYSIYIKKVSCYLNSFWSLSIFSRLHIDMHNIFAFTTAYTFSYLRNIHSIVQGAIDLSVMSFIGANEGGSCKQSIKGEQIDCFWEWF